MLKLNSLDFTANSHVYEKKASAHQPKTNMPKVKVAGGNVKVWADVKQTALRRSDRWRNV